MRADRSQIRLIAAVVAGGLIVWLSVGTRQSFGLFLQPITGDLWLGGYLYEAIGSYTPVWWAAVVLGLAAALLHWPIDDHPVGRLALAMD